jgi:hypothetical protein
MSDWKIVNLQDVNDSAAGRLDGLEVRMARSDLESRDVGVSLFRYGPNVRNPMSHQHREQDGPDGMDVVAVGGPKPDGGDGELTNSPWPDAA